MATRKDTLAALTPDDRNVNKGTPRGTAVIAKSLQKYGAGRSILVDRAGRIIAGNKTAEAAAEVGLENVRIVETDGHELVVVKRTDLDLDSAAARELAIADNRAAELNLDWDFDALSEQISDGVAVDDLFSGEELESLDRAFNADELVSGFAAGLRDRGDGKSLQITFTFSGDDADIVRDALGRHDVAEWKAELIRLMSQDA